MNSELIHRIQERAKRRFLSLPAGYRADVYIEAGKSDRVEIRRGKVETVLARREQGIGVRILSPDGQLGFFSSTDCTDNGIGRAFDGALEVLPYAEKDECHTFLSGNATPTSNEPSQDAGILSLTHDDMIRYSVAIEKAARGKKIIGFEKTAVNRYAGTIAIMNTEGVEVMQHSAQISGRCVPVAEEDGQRESGWGYDVAASIRDWDCRYEEIGREACAKATRKLGAKKIRSGEYPIILDPEGTADLLSVLLIAFHGYAVMKRKSIFCDKWGEIIADSCVNIVDDPFDPRWTGQRTVDDEGMPLRKVHIIRKGRLTSFLHNQYTAKRLSVDATASASRGYHSVPGISAHHACFVPTGPNADEIRKSIANGIFVTEILGLHTINTVSGDFSVGIYGLKMEQGHPGEPVSGVAMAGNIRDLLFRIRSVGDDLRYFGGSTSGSTVSLSYMNISGAS